MPFVVTITLVVLAGVAVLGVIGFLIDRSSRKYD